MTRGLRRTAEDTSEGHMRLRGWARSRGMPVSTAAKVMLDFCRRTGRLAEADEVRDRWFAVGRRVRDAVLAVADRVAPVPTGVHDSA